MCLSGNRTYRVRSIVYVLPSAGRAYRQPFEGSRQTGLSHFLLFPGGRISENTQPSKVLYETSSVYHKDNLLYGLQDKFKLDTDTVAKFATFMEAAHPINKNHKDNSADIVVFPYVKVDNEYNLKGHIQSTMSSQREPLGEKLTDHTNAPIGYERYTKDQTIPVTPYTTTASINGGVWMATEAQSSKSVKDVFMFNSAVDAMSFYEIHRNSIDLKNTALVSVGNLARENQIQKADGTGARA